MVKTFPTRDLNITKADSILRIGVTNFVIRVSKDFTDDGNAVVGLLAMYSSNSQLVAVLPDFPIIYQMNVLSQEPYPVEFEKSLIVNQLARTISSHFNDNGWLGTHNNIRKALMEDPNYIKDYMSKKVDRIFDLLFNVVHEKLKTMYVTAYKLKPTLFYKMNSIIE